MRDCAASGAAIVGCARDDCAALRKCNGVGLVLAGGEAVSGGRDGVSSERFWVGRFAKSHRT